MKGRGEEKLRRLNRLVDAFLCKSYQDDLVGKLYNFYFFVDFWSRIIKLKWKILDLLGNIQNYFELCQKKFETLQFSTYIPTRFLNLKMFWNQI